MKKQILAVILSLVILVGVLSAFWIGGVILGNAGSDTAAFNQPPDYLIIPGCRLEGSEPGICLEERVKAAAKYLREHPWCMAVASGGQGADEEISEAEAISRALQKRGIPARRILKEERSTSTYENFLFTKQLLDERKGDLPYYIAFVTNDFHVYRCRNTASYVGFVNPVAVSVKSSARTFYPNFPREIAAVAAYWLRYR